MAYVTPFTHHTAAVAFIKDAQTNKDSIYSFVGIKTTGADTTYKNVKNDIIFIKKIIPQENLILTFPRNLWVKNKVYNVYKPLSDTSEPVISSDTWCCLEYETPAESETLIKVYKCVEKPEREKGSVNRPDNSNPETPDGYTWEEVYSIIVNSDWEWENKDFIPLYKSWTEDVEKNLYKLPDIIKYISTYVTIRVYFTHDESGEDKLAKLPTNITYNQIGLLKNVLLDEDKIKEDMLPYATEESYRMTYKIELNNCVGLFQPNETIKMIGLNSDTTLGSGKNLADILKMDTDYKNYASASTLLLYDVDGEFREKIKDRTIVTLDTTKREQHNPTTISGDYSYASGEIVGVFEPELNLDNAEVLFYSDIPSVKRQVNQTETFFITIEL